MKKSDFVALFILALTLRASYVLALFDAGVVAGSEDQLMYINTATNSAIDFIFGAERPPFYPFLVWFFGVTGILVFQVVSDSLACVIMAKAFCDAGLSIRSAKIFGILYSINPLFIICSGLLLSDSIFVFEFSLAFYCFVKWIRSDFDLYILLMIVCFGLMAMTRTIGLYIGLVMICFVFGIFFRSWTVNRWRVACSGVLVFFLILSPQYIFNHIKHDSFAFSAQTGTHLRHWVFPSIYQLSGHGSFSEGQKIAREVRQEGPETSVFIHSRLDIGSFQALMSSLSTYDIASGWSKGTVMNVLAPAITISPLVRALEHPSFYGIEGAGVIEKVESFWFLNNDSIYLKIIISGVMIRMTLMIAAVIGLFKISALFKQQQTFPAGLAFLLIAGLLSVFIAGPVLNPKYRILFEISMVLFACIGLNFRQLSRRKRS